MTARRPSLRAAVAALALLSVAAATPVGPATAAPPPESICGVCGDGLVAAADRAGVPLTVEHGAATVRIRDDGSGRWYARVRISEGAADRLAVNATLRERVVRGAYERGRTVVEEPRDLRTRVENATLVVGFTVPDVAHRDLAGVVLVDVLDPRARRAGLRLEADRLRLVGPNGTVATRAPPGATVDGNAITLRRDGTGGGLSGDTRTAFAPSGGPLARGATTLAFVAAGVALVDGPSAVALGVAPALFLGGAALAFRTLRDGLPTVDPEVVARGVAGGGAVAAAVGALSLASSAVLDPAVAETVTAFAALYALVAAGALVLDRPSGRAALAWTLGVSAAVAAAASVVSITAVQTALLSVPAALWFPLGLARGGGGPVDAALTAAVVLAPFGAAALFDPPSSPLLALLLSAFTTVPWAGATILFGAPLYLLGSHLGAAGEATTDPGADRATGD